MGKVIAVCISEKKGTLKQEVFSARLMAGHGLLGDAHAGSWHRQVSLLAQEKIEEFRAKGIDVAFGAFGENIVTEGIDLRKLPVGTELKIGSEVRLLVTQIGKECHKDCAIRRQVGDCIMPREGIFAEVICGGNIAPNDSIEVIPPDSDSPFFAAVITVSDRCSRGECEDKSGPVAAGMLEAAGYKVVEKIIIPDGIEPLASELIRLSDMRQVNLIVTSGGTGFSQRDLTPEATIKVMERNAPGISEAMRVHSMQITERACLSRGTSGIRGRSLIVNLPGSPKAVKEDLEYILPKLEHGLHILRGSAGE